MVTGAVTAIVVLALLLVQSHDQLWLLYLIAFGYGLSATIVGPATTALLKDMLSVDDLGSSNALRQILSQGLRLLSPVVGAALYAAAVGGSLAVFDVATFMFSIIALASVRITESSSENTKNIPFRQQIRAGFVHIFSHSILRRLCSISAAAMLAIGFYESTDFAVIAALGKPPSFFGILMSIQAAGSILGGLLVTRAIRRLGEARVVGIGLACFAVASAAMTINSITVIVAAIMVLGAGISLFIVGLYTAQQRLTPARLQGRVGAASYVLTDIPQTISIGLGVALIMVVDYRILLAALAAVTLACAILLLAPRTKLSQPAAARHSDCAHQPEISS